MSETKHTENIPRKICDDNRHKKLRKAGFDTDGYVNSLEEILTLKDFGLPSVDIKGNWGFSINYKYVRVAFNYADCLADEILLLRELGML